MSVDNANEQRSIQSSDLNEYESNTDDDPDEITIIDSNNTPVAGVERNEHFDVGNDDRQPMTADPPSPPLENFNDHPIFTPNPPEISTVDKFKNMTICKNRPKYANF